MLGYIIAVIVVILAGNVVLIVMRQRRNRSEAKESREDRLAAARWHDEMVRNNDREQEDAEKYVKLRNRTLEMYEQVRRDADDDGGQGPEDDDD